MMVVLDSHRRIRSGEVSPKLSKKGPPVVLEVYSVEDAKKQPSVQSELIQRRILGIRGIPVVGEFAEHVKFADCLIERTTALG